MSRVIQSRQHLVTRVDYARHRGADRPLSQIELICMHCTAGDSFASSMGWLNRPNSTNKASYNYGIDRDGSIIRMLPATVTAYAQGDSAWPNPVHYPPGNGGHSINHKTLSIAWANKDDGEALTEEQVDSGLWLCLTFMQRREISIAPSQVIGHRECSPGRKVDPLPATMRMKDWRQMLSETVIE